MFAIDVVSFAQHRSLVSLVSIVTVLAASIATRTITTLTAGYYGVVL